MNTPKSSVWPKKILALPLKVWVVLAAEFAFLAILLFSAAGTIRWLQAWAFLFIIMSSLVPIAIGLAKHDPNLLDERLKLVHSDQPAWDRALLNTIIVAIIAWLAVPGLDYRFNWSLIPAWLQIAGGIMIPVLLYLQYAVMRQNTFLAPTVKLQSDRRHEVITTGAYAIVRHPFYALIIPLFPAIGLLLGSWWAVLLCLPLASLFAYRAIREERYLQRELKGYADYMKQTRFRLIPFIW